MGIILQANSPVAVATRMALSIGATLFLLTVVAIVMRPNDSGDADLVSVAAKGVLPARVSLAAVR